MLQTKPMMTGVMGTLRFTHPAFDVLRTLCFIHPEFDVLRTPRFTHPAFDALRTLRFTHPAFDVLRTLRVTYFVCAVLCRTGKGAKRRTRHVLMRAQMLLLASMTSGIASAVEFQAFAPVLSVEPIIETHYEPVTRRVCTEPDESAREFGEVAATIGEDIRRQTQRWQQQQRCSNVTEQRASEHIAGYKVTYRYGGETQTTRLSYDPGERMPVNVSLSPMQVE
jgi:uncharacterized protein YcfJ